MANPSSCAGTLPGALTPAARSGLVAPALLLATGALIAGAVALSKLAAVGGAPMLGFLAGVWLIAGTALTLPAFARRGIAGLPAILPYGAGAGLLMVAPSAMGYLAVGQTGAGFISLSFAFPVLLTWVIARALRMGHARPGQGAGVAAALAGGVILAVAKLAETGGPGGGALWVGVAAGIPVALAFGNIFRTRYWPRGERPLPLAALSVLAGAVLILPLAVLTEGAALPRLWQDPALLRLVLATAVIVAAQYVLQFRLQEIAGPIYMSQIGGVAALSGAVMAVGALGEALPPGFWPALALIAAGTALFQRAASARP